MQSMRTPRSGTPGHSRNAPNPNSRGPKGIGSAGRSRQLTQLPGVTASTVEQPAVAMLLPSYSQIESLGDEGFDGYYEARYFWNANGLYTRRVVFAFLHRLCHYGLSDFSVSVSVKKQHYCVL